MLCIALPWSNFKVFFLSKFVITDDVLFSKGKPFLFFSEDKRNESYATAPQGIYQYVEHGRRQCYQIREHKNDADFRIKRKSLAVALLKSRVSVSFSSPGTRESSDSGKRTVSMMPSIICTRNSTEEKSPSFTVIQHTPLTYSRFVPGIKFQGIYSVTLYIHNDFR